VPFAAWFAMFWMFCSTLTCCVTAPLAVWTSEIVEGIQRVERVDIGIDRTC
jgi:hypothetical protein